MVFSLTLLAEPISLIYINEEAVGNRKFELGTLTSQGIVMSVEKALAAKGTPIISTGMGLFRGSILRLDNELGVAIIKIGDPIQNDELTKAHNITMEKINQFFPARYDDSGNVVTAPETPSKKESGPFMIRINEEELGLKPLQLQVRRGEADMKVEIIRTSDDPIWQVAVYATATPDLMFWKKGKSKSLTTVPLKKLTYHYQAMFGPMTNGKSFKIPIEISNIKEKEEPYIIHLEVIPKEGESMKVDIPVKFVY